MSTPRATLKRRLLFALLLVPFVGTLWVPFYNSADPPLFGFPYFYWYQFAWILVGAVINAVAYFATRARGDA